MNLTPCRRGRLGDHRTWSLRFLSVCSLCLWGCSSPAQVHVGSKSFTESVILGEMVADLAGPEAVHETLGSTRLCWDSLRNGNVDIYPEYTGTITHEILAGSHLGDDEALRRALAERGLRMSQPLGFSDNYALGMLKDVADRLGVTKISDLTRHPGLKFGFSNEFMERTDGWRGLRDRYGLPQQEVHGLEHALAYRSLQAGAIQVTELYSTDAKIRAYNIRVLQDDLGYFPAYQAVLLYRQELQERAPAALAAVLQLQERIPAEAMLDMNARVELDHVPEKQVAADFLAKTFGLQVRPHIPGLGETLLRYTLQHLRLVAISLAAAVVIAIPLGILAASRPRLGQGILAVSGVIQTIPSIALLVILIPLPFMGTGVRPAIVALFLYSLLPIVQNTYAGWHGIPANLRESAEALGLPAGARLRLVELPLAARSILAGIKIAAVINVGTATLGGFIGAGGYGELIFAGIRQDNAHLILEGAIPAAVLALLVQGLFELAERTLVPRGLRLKAGG